ncbi:hypothetical protein ABZX51_008955 [Aspergillus tubingensis]
MGGGGACSTLRLQQDPARLTLGEEDDGRHVHVLHHVHAQRRQPSQAGKNKSCTYYLLLLTRQSVLVLFDSAAIIDLFLPDMIGMSEMQESRSQPLLGGRRQG